MLMSMKKEALRCGVGLGIERAGATRSKLDKMKSAVSLVRAKREDAAGVLHPHEAFMAGWTVITLLIMAYWICVLPIRVAFVEYTHVSDMPIAIAVDYVLDIFLWADIVLRCNLDGQAAPRR